MSSAGDHKPLLVVVVVSTPISLLSSLVTGTLINTSSSTPPIIVSWMADIASSRTSGDFRIWAMPCVGSFPKLSRESGGGEHAGHLSLGMSRGGLAAIKHSLNISCNGWLLLVRSMGATSFPLGTPRELVGMFNAVGAINVCLVGVVLILCNVDEPNWIFLPIGVANQLRSSSGGLPASLGLAG